MPLVAALRRSDWKLKSSAELQAASLVHPTSGRSWRILGLPSSKIPKNRMSKKRNKMMVITIGENWSHMTSLLFFTLFFKAQIWVVFDKIGQIEPTKKVHKFPSNRFLGDHINQISDFP